MKRGIALALLILLLIVPRPLGARDAGPAARIAHPARAASPAPLSLTLSHLAYVTAPSPAVQTEDIRRKFEPALLKKLLAAPDQEPVRAIVWMRDQLQIEQISLAGMDRLARREAVVSALRSRADRSQREVRAVLEKARLAGRVASYKVLWIVNAIAVQAPKETFWELASHPDVGMIVQDHVRYLPQRQQDDPTPAGGLAQLGQVQWNIQRVQADRVWQALGITGQGTVVASMDSGVDWQHPQLMTRYRGYTGKPVAVHEGNWYCATDEGYTYPGDGLGHGTHVTGIMVGQDGIGVAPGAQWIAVKVFDNQGTTYDSWIHDGFQWILAPGGVPALAPDVVNSSWGSKIDTDEAFLPDVRALRAAEIVPIFSAGNDGPESETIESPASYPESFAVGATDRQDLIARFSSRGPSPWDEVKPEASAPGVGIVSTLPGGALASRSGTSMAAPHVSGLVALIRSANPALSVDEIEQILTQTALPLGEGHPNDTYGWGLVNAYAAVARAGDFGQVAGRVTTAGQGTPIAGARVAATVHGGTAGATTTTGDAGYYALSLSSGQYDVTFTSFGYAPRTAYNVEAGAGLTTTLDVALDALPTGVLRGTVTEAGTNVPLPAAVYVPGTPATTTASAGSGSYTLTLPEGVHVVRAEAPAHRFVTATVNISAGTSVQQDLSLEPAPTILLVDSGAWYNDSQRAYYERALAEARYTYDLHVIANIGITGNDVPTAGLLLPYDLVVWSAPQDAPGYIGATEAITRYLTSGGRLLLSGQDVAFWDDGGSGLFYAPYFRDYIKASLVEDNAPTRTLHGQGTLFSGLTVTITGAGGADNQVYPDVIAATDEDHATSAWTYQQDGSGGQTVGPCLPYRVVYLSFGLEAVNDAAARRQILEQSIDWLMAPPEPAGVELKAGETPQIGRAGSPVTHTVRLRNTGEVLTDTYTLNLEDSAWPIAPQFPFTAELGACKSITIQVAAHIPAGIGWQTWDTATLAARSTLSPALVSQVSLASKTPAPLLLVNGARFFHVERQYQAALERNGIPYDYLRVKETWPLAVPATDTLAMYPMVVWYTAYDWFMPLDDTEESRLMAYLDGGGRLFLSSQDYLYFAHGNPLARDYLGVLDYTESVTPTVAQGQTWHPVSWGLGPYELTYPYTNWSDALTQTLAAQVAFRDQHGLPIGLTNPGQGWRTSFYAFPLETLDADAAAAVMGRTVGWLSWLGSSTWEADRRVHASGDEVAMSCALHNDGWSDVAAASFSVTLPGELSFVSGSLAPAAIYYPLTRTITWQGSLARQETASIDFRARVAGSLPESTYITVPVQIGYRDQSISFERPYILRINAPDLSPSALSVEPAIARPGPVLTYTLAVPNVGVRDAVATVTATLPAGATFTGTLDSGGAGSGQVTNGVLSWTGPVAAGHQVTLRYHVLLDPAQEGLVVHRAQVVDQYGEQWLVEARALVRFWKAYLPSAYQKGSSR